VTRISPARRPLLPLLRYGLIWVMVLGSSWVLATTINDVVDGWTVNEGTWVLVYAAIWLASVASLIDWVIRGRAS
jgi:uncharacterized membrane protein YvlD (DUF360 family)